MLCTIRFSYFVFPSIFLYWILSALTLPFNPFICSHHPQSFITFFLLTSNNLVFPILQMFHYSKIISQSLIIFYNFSFPFVIIKHPWKLKRKTRLSSSHPIRKRQNENEKKYTWVEVYFRFQFFSLRKRTKFNQFNQVVDEWFAVILFSHHQP